MVLVLSQAMRLRHKLTSKLPAPTKRAGNLQNVSVRSIIRALGGLVFLKRWDSVFSVQLGPADGNLRRRL